jgi:hypothetical protein
LVLLAESDCDLVEEIEFEWLPLSDKEKELVVDNVLVLLPDADQESDLVTDVMLRVMVIFIVSVALVETVTDLEREPEAVAL